MAHISLRAYVEYIEDRLARDALTEVVAQCRHVLESYPKFIDAYRLLARALMDQEKNQDALDLFQRVLSADPNDFVAHIGISEVYHETGSLDQAIWHLERAYEQVPSNIDLQEAVKELYAERDGRAPRKIHLTGGALARMYANGKLYDQALLELRKALAADPERLDLQVLMANTLWNYHQYVEAGKLAGEILRRLPNSIDANALLARMWLQFGKPAEAQPFLNTVKQLDPYLSYEIEKGEDAPADAFKLLMLDYTADRHASEIGAADWVSEIGAIAKERGITGPLPPDAVPEIEPKTSITDIFGQPEAEPLPAPSEDSPEWLSEALSSTAAPAESEDYVPVEQPPPLPSSQPDWLSEALGTAGVATGLADETAPSPDAEPALEQGEQQYSEQAEQGALSLTSDAPDWMEEALGAAASPPPPPSLEGDEEIPDWMQEVGITPATPASSPDSGDMPDWLAETLGQPADSMPERTSDTSADEMPDWLAETLGSGQPSEEAAPDWQAESIDFSGVEPSDSPMTPGEAVPEPAAARDAPDWLDDILSGEPEDAIVTGQVDQAAADVVSDDWLDDLLGVDAPDAEAEAEEDWRAQPLEEPPAEVTVEPEPARMTQASLPPGTLETWNQASERMTGSVGKAAAPISASEPLGEEIPDWLNSGADLDRPATQDEPGEEAGVLPEWLTSAGSSASESPSDDEEDALPDWLAAAAPESDDAESGEGLSSDQEDSLPDWLQGGTS